MKKWIWIGVVAVVAIFFYATYNGFVNREEGLKSAWSNVETQYQRRADLIPNLVNTVKGYAAHETQTLNEVTEARARATSINLSADDLTPERLAQFQRAQAEVRSALGRLIAVSESYPDLKANQNFLELQAQLEGTENRISVARKEFNEVAKTYNVAVRRFPANLVAKLFGFGQKPYFEAAEGTDDQIAAAKKYAEEDEGAKKAGFNIDADALATAATKRRDDAVAAKQAEEEARRQAEEEARKAEEARQARNLETDYFTMVLPDWFPIDQFTVQTTDHADQGDGMGAYTMVLVTAKESFYPNGKNNPNVCPNFGICADTNGLPGVGCAFLKDLGNTKGHTVRVWGGAYGEWNGKTIDDRPFGMSLDDYANLLASCTTLK